MDLNRGQKPLGRISASDNKIGRSGSGRRDISSALSKQMESFALDLLRLIRGVRVYPSKHASFFGIAERIVAEVPTDATGCLTIGVTPSELIVHGEFFGGKVARLAAFLHDRKLLRVHWSSQTSAEEVWIFARLLSTPKLEGKALCQKLRSEGVYAIEVEPLKIEQIHGEIAPQALDSKTDPEIRRRTAWLRLINRKTPEDQIASALISEQFWLEAKTSWAELGMGDSEGFTRLVLELGERFEGAISLLPEHQKGPLLDYFAEIGRRLSARQLVEIIAREGQRNDIGQGVASLLRDLDGEQFVDLLAGLTARGDRSTRRLVEVYRRFNPGAEALDLLSVIRNRLSLGKDSGFALEVWKAVENLVLNHREEPFMDMDYSESLEELAEPSLAAYPKGQKPEWLEPPERHLDRVIAGLAIEGNDYWRSKLLHRIEVHSQRAGIYRLLDHVNLVEEVLPGLLDCNPLLVRSLFKKGLSKICRATPEERQTLARFARAHQRILLDTALKSLEEEEQMTVRFFLVNLLSSFSSASTPAFVSKARHGTWYLSRNLAIVLGQQGFAFALPALKDLLNHFHPKVRREAEKAIQMIRRSLGDFVGERDKERSDRWPGAPLYDLQRRRSFATGWN